MAITLDEFRKRYPNLSDDSIADLAAVTLSLSGHKETRPGFLGLMKKADPNVPIPEIDTKAQIDEALKAEREAREKLEKSLADKDFAASLAAQKNEARTRYGLSDDDLPKMEEMMKKGELPADYKWAAMIFRQQTETSTPTNYGDSGYGPLNLKGHFADKYFEGLMENEQDWSLRTAHAMVDEMKKGRSPAF